MQQDPRIEELRKALVNASNREHYYRDARDMDTAVTSLFNLIDKGADWESLVRYGDTLRQWINAGETASAAYANLYLGPAWTILDGDDDNLNALAGRLRADLLRSGAIIARD